MKTENKYELQERELMSEDGIFSPRHRTLYDSIERCAQCGYELLPGEEALMIQINGDVIHKACWCEYAEENVTFFCKESFEEACKCEEGLL